MTILLLIAAAAAVECGALTAQPSGGDYLNPADANKLRVVEAYHFTPNVESLKRGESGSVAGDLAYTLEHFPNHHRALAALVRLSQRDHTAHPPGAHFSVACYFERALRFNRGDAQVRRLYAAYLLAMQRSDDALEQLELALKSEPGDATTHYNLGLLYLKRGQFGPARTHAQQAYALGFPLPALRERLQAAGQWAEP